VTEAQLIDDRDVPWSTIRGLALRVVEYLPLAERRPGADLLGRAHVRDFSGRMPYAVLEVACIDTRPGAWASEHAMFPVYHREDFRAVDHAMSIVTGDTEVLVGYRPIRFPWYVPFKRGMPTMVVHVSPKDQERRDGEPYVDYMKRTFPVWTYEPLVTRFGGRWLYIE